ncbi:MAG: NAD(P)/FAD-dependent oxidoreductase [Pyrinomonadaceae bacterium]
MHDVVIIGGGPAGLSAALWCDDLGLDTLLLESDSKTGGQLHRIHNPILNYIGLRAANGLEIFEKFSEVITSADFDVWTNAQIDTVDCSSKRVSLSSGEQLQSIALIIATGVRRRKLGIPGEAEFARRGVIESATRDRELFKDQDVCVIGGGDAAVENALLLAEVCATVTLVHRGKKLRARRELLERLQSNHCVTVFTESVLTRIIGNDDVAAVEVQRKDGLKPFQIAVRGVLIRIGVEPNTEPFAGQLQFDENRYITVNAFCETSEAFVFAAGDVANPVAPTISGATGMAATAAKVIAARLNSKARR